MTGRHISTSDLGAVRSSQSGEITSADETRRDRTHGVDSVMADVFVGDGMMGQDRAGRSMFD